VAALGHARSTYAQAPDARAQAEQLFREGRQAATAGDYVRACEKFAESQRLDPSTGTLLNLGNCEEHQGHLSSARNYYRTALARLDASDSRVAPASRRLALVEERMSRLTITVPTPVPLGITIRCDGTPVPAAEFGVPSPLDPGEHVVLVSAPGHKDRREVVLLAEKESREMVAAPGAPEDVAPGGPLPPVIPAASAPVERSLSSFSVRTVGWIVGGVGIAGLGLAAASGIVLLDDKKTLNAECMGKVCSGSGWLDAVNSGKTWLPINTAAWVVGIAGLGVGAYLVLANSGGARPPATAGLAAVPGGFLACAHANF
jgi:hypothetical protein